VVKPPDLGEKKFDLGRGAVMVFFILFTILFGLVVGRQALDQKEPQSPEPAPTIEADEPAAPTQVLPDSKTPRVSSQARPKGWVDLKSDDLRGIMALPGMSRSRALGVLKLRESKPDLKLEDLLSVPGITQADLDAWREFIWEGA
jgi:DNA uptake protein ComE-like DNA-binding protein